jgi:hypothetical protein
MKTILHYLLKNKYRLIPIVLGLAVFTFCLVFQLGTLVHGLSRPEVAIAQTRYGWHGIYDDPLYLPLTVLRSVIFKVAAVHTATILRLPNVILSIITVVTTSILLWLWYGYRTGVLGSIIFASNAWVLHISRLATNSIAFLCVVPFLLLTLAIIHKKFNSLAYVCLICFSWGLVLYIPGMIWVLIASLILIKTDLGKILKAQPTLQARVAMVASFLVCLPLLIKYLINVQHLKLWIGLPQRFVSLKTYGKRFAGVPIHLLVRGPEYPFMWLGRAPILDIFVLSVTLIGTYFYIQHLSAFRTRLLISYAVIGWVLITLGGAFDLSFLVALALLVAAAGIGYLLREWLKVFPSNPFARSLGIGLISLLVLLSVGYNFRAYYLAWPNSPATRSAYGLKLSRNYK